LYESGGPDNARGRQRLRRQVRSGWDLYFLSGGIVSSERMPESPCPPDAIAENVPVNANCLAAVELVTDLDGALSLSAARQDLGWVEIVSHVSNELLFLPVHDVPVVPVA
jgi:hypothetical protein